ncbi:hypothetical protein [Sphingomonas glacialis]|uniref:Uncharacterized protein n=1 Tax=Sphingomonas glacialis TaxID=658225 RepID=A0A502FRD3_9SPHN|nr:hypothetical protein [Sphingomonas glacialis]TPG51971.1 hypothetical protein EAH76_14650 [Sphingomonas glacialis]
MADEQFAEDLDALRWMQAAAFMDLHGEMWLRRAIEGLKSSSEDDTDHHWADLINKMRAIAYSPRQ